MVDIIGMLESLTRGFDSPLRHVMFNSLKNKNDMNAKKVMQQKLQVNLDMNDVVESVAKAVNQLPILTEEEVDELQEAAHGMMMRMEDKGCWLGLGFVRKSDRELSNIAAVHGNFSTLALMVAEAMNNDPMLEKVLLLALALKKSMGKMNETEDNEDEDYNEEEE